MRRFKVWVCFAANLLLLVAVAEPALAKRKRPTKPAGDAVPATEVEPDASAQLIGVDHDNPGIGRLHRRECRCRRRVA